MLCHPSCKKRGFGSKMEYLENPHGALPHAKRRHNMEIITQNEKILHIGMDVHKDTISLCSFDFQQNRLGDEFKTKATAKHVVKYLNSLRRKYGDDVFFACGYEAGPTGYGLCRALQNAGFGCVVMAPSTMANPDGKKKVKTDRIDARAIARILAYKAYSPVHLPSEEMVSLKEYVNTRDAKVELLKRAKQQLFSFLLRNGKSYPESGDYWTKKFFKWIDTVQFENEWLEESFKEYLTDVNSLICKVSAMDRKIREIAELESVREKVKNLTCLVGVDIHTAVTSVVTVGDFGRFRTATQYSSFIGLCPGEDSSGQREKKLGITKAGNTRLRKLYCEAAKAIARSHPYGKKSARIQERQKGASPEVVVYADKAARRIRTKIEEMKKKGKNHNVATVAGARELSCFIWGGMNGKIA